MILSFSFTIFSPNRPLKKIVRVRMSITTKKFVKK